MIIRRPFRDGYGPDGLRSFHKGGGKGGGLGAIVGGVVGGLVGGPMGALAGAGIGGSAGNAYDSQKAAKAQAKAQSRAAEQAAASAQKTYEQQERALNRQNQKKADVPGLLSENQQASLLGNAGTMLTGPQGVNQNSLLLGKKSLLGG